MIVIAFVLGIAFGGLAAYVYLSVTDQLNMR